MAGHRFRFKGEVSKLRFLCFLYLSNIVAFLAAIAFGVIVGMDPENKFALYCGLACLAALVIGMLIFLISKNSLRCPLCRGQFLAGQACSKHRKAGSLIGSYRLKIVMCAFFIGRFRCQYCGEPVQVKSRKG